MQKSSRLGFSLIELSIVILIIGILVIGITKGSRIISEARLKSAQALTKSSPVASISDLAFWIESTSQKSFDDSEKINTAIGAMGTITHWYDINPQTTDHNDATQPGGASLQPRYIANVINGLPAVNFDGVNDKMAFNSSSIAFEGLGWTVYTVTQVRGSSLHYFIGPGASQGFYMGYNSNSNIFGHSSGNTSAFSMTAYSAPKPVLNMFSYKSWLANKFSYYAFGRGVNGSGTINGTMVKTSTMAVGSYASGNYFPGDIAEIIIFNRALTDAEDSVVKEYLKTKWSIRL